MLLNHVISIYFGWLVYRPELATLPQLSHALCTNVIYN
jgi:hypothetical protein